MSEFRFTFARSGGPGGQHVNKANTKVTLRWGVVRSGSLPEDVKQRFLSRYARRVNQEGEFLLHSQRFRDQSRNEADCLEKLRAMLLAVEVPPKPRRPSRPSRGSRERRLREKHARSDAKRGRRAPSSEA